MAVKPIPEGYTTVTPYLAVDDGKKLLEFVKQAFGAEEVMSMPTPDGKIGHWNRTAEIMFGFARAEALGKLLTISLFRRIRWMKKAEFKKMHSMLEYSL